MNKIEQGLKEAKEGKTTKFDLDKYITDMNKRTPWQKRIDNIIWWIRYGIWQKIEAMPREHVWDCQRIKRGFSDQDVWGFDYFLAPVIAKGCRELQRQAHGCPGDLYEKFGEEKAFEEWKMVLGKIAKTFETAQKILDNDLYIISSEEYTEEWYNKWNKIAKDIGKTKEYNCRAMTLEEIKEYEKGWKFFAKYFYNLWD
uniref:Uncharacterized protein n=1 Tax=viral metagenome TaxID=1070528 RepID=A0A6M3IJE0_9ZZZZ